MTSVTLSFFGPPEQKHVVKVPPMQSLKDALHAASTKFKPALDADACQLQLNKKAVDLSTPFRLLNIPAGSKLDIIKNFTVGVPATTHSTGSAVSEPMTTTTAAVPTSSASAAMVQQQAVVPPAAPAVVPLKKVIINEPQANDVTSNEPGVAPAVPSSAAEPAAVQTELAALGIQRAVFVFHQKVLEAAAEEAARASSAMDVDPPDDFFELTTDDLARLQQQANAKKQQEAVFRTRAAREAEEARAAVAMGPVRVRLHFPDGSLLQVDFKATDLLSEVQDLVCKCAAPQYAPAVYLYITPPKTVLKDAAATLYSLKLVPAAHIHVGVDSKKVPADADAAQDGSYLRPEVQALMQDHVPQQRQRQDAGPVDSSSGGGGAGAVAEVQRAVRAAAATSRAEARGEAGASKVPKWLKVGKR